MIDTITRVSIWVVATPLRSARRCIIYPGVTTRYEYLYHGTPSDTSNRPLEAFKRTVAYISPVAGLVSSLSVARKMGAATPHIDARGVTDK